MTQKCKHKETLDFNKNVYFKQNFDRLKNNIFLITS